MIVRPISPWPEWLDDVWAKSPAEPGQNGESLAQHTWCVLERLGDLARIRPRLPAQLGESRLWHRLFWACLLHDLGKAAPGFQDRLRGHSETPAARQWGRHRHEIISLAFVGWIFPPAAPGSIADPAARTDRRWVVGAIAAHHRDAAEIDSLYPDAAQDQLAEVLASLAVPTIEGVHRWLAECAAAWGATLGLVGVQPVELPPRDEAVRLVREEGAASIQSLLREYRRWVARLEDQAEPTTPEILLRGLLLQADHTASAHTRSLEPVTARQEALRAHWKIDDPYPHQEQCAAADGSLLLTAPTGSGKTEAALLWAARQAEGEAGLPRLFYALPYQASMNAMYQRLGATFSAGRVGLQHGRSLLALHRFAMEHDPSPERAARQARWRRNLARLNYYPVRVFSPYQMLKAMYRLKGYEAMLLDYHGAAFIFDEIHTYAPDRLGLILALVTHLRAEFGARFMVMSATLPSIARRHLIEAIGPHTEVHASAGLYQEFRRHRIKLLDGDLLNRLDLVMQTARQGSSVLVCCNTVQRAQDAWRWLREHLSDLDVALLHGRFNGRDRLAREEIVHHATGSRDRPGRPIILVATQVVEVSLDINFDTIFSDPAPLEALIQRFGRVNRWRLQKGLALVHVFREPADGQRIYDQNMVENGLEVLESIDGMPVDEAQVGSLLDAVYQGTVASEWEEAFARSRRDGQRILRGLRPFQSDENLADLFDAAFDSVEVLPASLLNEYEPLREEDPIEATSLLVPISEQRRRQLWHAGLIRPETRPPVVEVPYSTEIGLDLSAVRGSSA